MPEFDIGTGCPDLLIGPNCTLSWREHFEPYSSMFIYVYSAVHLYLSVALAIIVYRIIQEKRSPYDSTMRLKTCSYWLLSEVCWCIFHLLGMNLEFDVDAWQGKMSVFFLFTAVVFFFQAYNNFASMHLKVVDDGFERLGYFANVNKKFLNHTTILWPYYIVILVVMILLFTNKLKRSILGLLRIGFSMVTIMLFQMVTINAYYQYSAGKMILSMATRRLEENDLHSPSPAFLETVQKWKKVGSSSVVLGLYNILIGGSIWLYILALVIFNLFINPNIFFVTFVIVGPAVVFPASIIVYLMGSEKCYIYCRKTKQSRLDTFLGSMTKGESFELEHYMQKQIQDGSKKQCWLSCPAPIISLRRPQKAPTALISSSPQSCRNDSVKFTEVTYDQYL